MTTGFGRGRSRSADAAPGHEPPVVALVASAGGLRAVTAVLRALSADLPAAVLVLLHQPPDMPNHLATILDSRTALHVRTATDDGPLTPGTVLVTPPGRHLLVVSPRTVGLIESEAPPRPSADLLLTTMSIACGPRALAVVLTGRGSDGQVGTRAVKRCGGSVFVQDQASSEYFDMPGAAISTGLVDAVLSLARIPAAIHAHVLDARVRPPRLPC